MKLYSYFRSGAAWRVRIALHLKGLVFETVSLNLRTGAQSEPGWLARNPQGLVPALELDDGRLLTQSLAIIDWLDETHPLPPLLPPDRIVRARVRAVALAVAADTHPVQNLGVLKRIEALAGPDAARAWGHDTVARGLGAVEAMLASGRGPGVGPFAFGPAPTLADICIVPQLLNARRFGVDLAPFPLIRNVEAASADIDAFVRAHPDRQPDAD